MTQTLKLVLMLYSVVAAALAFAADDRFAAVEITTIEVRPGIYMLMGAGGNIGVSTGDDGLLIIDDQYAPLSERIAVALEKLGSRTPDYILNTHYHGDHVGGNEFFGTTGTIIAHDNVRARLLNGEGQPARLPVITYGESISIYFNGEELEARHLPTGHTDGDSLVYFRTANVLHMGDHFFNGMFPFVDLDSGGNVQQYIANIETALDIANAETRIMPGHGPLAEHADLVRFRDMLIATTRIVTDQMGARKSLDEIKLTGLGADWAAWGKGFINEERWITTVYTSYSN